MNRFFKDVRTIERMKRGPLGPYITLYGDQLLANGYRKKSCRGKLQLSADFTRWLDRKKIVAEQVTVRHWGYYLESRERSGVGIHLGDRAAVIDFLKLLRQQRVTKERIPLPLLTPSQKLLREYDLYLQRKRALSLAKRINYLPFVLRFVVSLFGSGRVDLASLPSSLLPNFHHHPHAYLTLTHTPMV